MHMMTFENIAEAESTIRRLEAEKTILKRKVIEKDAKIESLEKEMETAKQRISQFEKLEKERRDEEKKKEYLDMVQKAAKEKLTCKIVDPHTGQACGFTAANAGGFKIHSKKCKFALVATTTTSSTPRSTPNASTTTTPTPASTAIPTVSSSSTSQTAPTSTVSASGLTPNSPTRSTSSSSTVTSLPRQFSPAPVISSTAPTNSTQNDQSITRTISSPPLALSAVSIPKNVLMRTSPKRTSEEAAADRLNNYKRSRSNQLPTNTTATTNPSAPGNVFIRPSTVVHKMFETVSIIYSNP